ncbi:MAG: Cobyrinic acid ac-diamide synthase [Candidatus Saccharibacteria bacterium]|nr:Cobyrinic acid ac-diamide synthase [Candidatus Saccharibacteria bacterium]
MSRTVAILNQKGGVGKTTTAVNLGAYLAKAGKSVLLVDLDPQGNATSGLGIDKQSLNETLYDALFNHAAAPNILMDTNIEGLQILPSNANLAGAEVQLVSSLQRELQLRTMLEQFNHDIILIDCPPSLGLLTINALSASDFVMIPVQTEYYALEGLGQLLSVVQRVKEAINPKLEILGVLLTMFDSRTSLSDQVMAEVKKHFADKVFSTVIPRNVRLAEAPSFGQPISEHDKWSKGARAYKQLSKEFLTRLEGAN